MIELIEKIEGEAKLDFSFDIEKKIDFVNIEFLSSRHIENILKGKNPLDALVINPRVCGICGHAHLIATVQALENCYETIEVSNKAKIIRELTLNFELIQNHFKWFYLVLQPLFGNKQNIYKSTYPSQLMGKAIATVGGQYPHTSYAIVGGIVSEILAGELIKLENYIDETIEFYQKHVVNVDIGNFMVCNSIEKLFTKEGDLLEILKLIKKKKLSKVGKSFDRFIVFGENSYFTKGRSQHTRVNNNIDMKYLQESVIKNSYAKNIRYNKKFYETGPLSRAMLNKIPLIKESHRRYQDSIFSRILARVCEIPQLLNHSKELIKQIELDEPSYIKPKVDISKVSGTGISCVEAARGSLIHKVHIEKNKILNYDIITPTQWNLGNGTKDDLGISQKAMIGADNTKLAQIIFKSFDVCSVCTTH
jgi:hydrogenase large subunit